MPTQKLWGVHRAEEEDLGSTPENMPELLDRFIQPLRERDKVGGGVPRLPTGMLCSVPSELASWLSFKPLQCVILLVHCSASLGFGD